MGEEQGLASSQDRGDSDGEGEDEGGKVDRVRGERGEESHGGHSSSLQERGSRKGRRDEGGRKGMKRGGIFCAVVAAGEERRPEGSSEEDEESQCLDGSHRDERGRLTVSRRETLKGGDDGHSRRRFTER